MRHIVLLFDADEQPQAGVAAEFGQTGFERGGTQENGQEQDAPEDVDGILVTAIVTTLAERFEKRAIGDGGEEPDPDRRDLRALYDTLEGEILPAFADAGRWTGMMRASIRMAGERFSSDRMVTEYFARLYSAP